MMRKLALILGMLFPLTAIPGLEGRVQAGRFGEGTSRGGGVELKLGQARPVGARMADGSSLGHGGGVGRGGFSLFRGHEPLAPHPAWQAHGGGHRDPAFLHQVPSRSVLPHQGRPFFEGGHRFRFHSKPFQRVPIRIRSYPVYTVDPGYLVDPYRGDPYDGAVHRGEGAGATVYRPDRDYAAEAGQAPGVEDGRPGIAYPRVARVLEGNAVGEPGTWTDARTGAETTVTPTRDLDGEGQCREFRHAVAMASGEMEALGVACRTREGIWEILP